MEKAKRVVWRLLAASVCVMAVSQAVHQKEELETANRNLLRMMQQMEEQKAQLAQTTARNMEKEKSYQQQLNHDALTGAYNRRYYEEVARNNIGPAGIALMDIDDFKICNDTYGHHAGDMALETVAKTIRSCIRETDLLIRYGGDEFLLVLAGIPADFFRTKLEQIRDAAQKSRWWCTGWSYTR